ncbi:hypothetical protein B0H12DRAFT_1077172 [Mycena haematopus]|nr:hypothetical protein B0H12DRAFT_1077172 [Mycena haematopus]
MEINVFCLHQQLQQLEQMEVDEMEDERRMAGAAIAIILLGTVEAHRLRREAQIRSQQGRIEGEPVANHLKHFVDVCGLPEKSNIVTSVTRSPIRPQTWTRSPNLFIQQEQ